MRNTAVLITATLLVLALAGAALSAEAIGYINSDQLRAEYAGARDLDSQFEASLADWRTEARDMESEIDRLVSELESQQLLLSDEAVTEKQTEIQQKQIEFESYLNEVWGQGGLAAQREAELWQPVFDRINEILEEIGTEGEYAMIFDAARMGLVYADPETDLTQQVLDRLNESEE
jgi:outer membrane protein